MDPEDFFDTSDLRAGRFEAELPGVVLSDFAYFFETTWGIMRTQVLFESDSSLPEVAPVPELAEAWHEARAGENWRLWTIKNSERDLLDVAAAHFRRDSLLVEICDPRVGSPLLPHALRWLTQHFEVRQLKKHRDLPLSVELLLAPYVANWKPDARGDTGQGSAGDVAGEVEGQLSGEEAGPRAGTFERVREAHKLLKQAEREGKSRTRALQKAGTDSRTYYKWCERATGEQPL